MSAVDAPGPATRLLVLGCGTIGAPVARLARAAGLDVTAVDVDGAAVAALEAGARPEGAGPADGAGTLRVGLLADLADLAPGAPDVVLDALPEDLAVKVATLGAVLDRVGGAPTVLSATSQTSITVLAAALGRARSAVVGSHLFTPVERMRLVEVIPTAATGAGRVEATVAFWTGLGKVAVVCRKDRPGFIASRAYAALRAECLRMVEEGIASVEDVDTVMKLGFNFPLGPFELADHQGVDTGLRTMEMLHAAYGDRFVPSPLLRSLVASGRTGRRAGAGFYDYPEPEGEA